MLTLNSILQDLTENKINQVVDSSIIGGGKKKKSGSKKSKKSKKSGSRKGNHGCGCHCGW